MSLFDLCQDCKHRLGDHHSIIGCQHLEPVYTFDGLLIHHDKCKCQTGLRPGLKPTKLCVDPLCLLDSDHAHG